MCDNRSRKKEKQRRKRPSVASLNCECFTETKFSRQSIYWMQICTDILQLCCALRFVSWIDRHSYYLSSVFFLFHLKSVSGDYRVQRIHAYVSLKFTLLTSKWRVSDESHLSSHLTRCITCKDSYYFFFTHLTSAKHCFNLLSGEKHMLHLDTTVRNDQWTDCMKARTSSMNCIRFHVE